MTVVEDIAKDNGIMFARIKYIPQQDFNNADDGYCSPEEALLLHKVV